MIALKSSSNINPDIDQLLTLRKEYETRDPYLSGTICVESFLQIPLWPDLQQQQPDISPSQQSQQLNIAQQQHDIKTPTAAVSDKPFDRASKLKQAWSCMWR